SALCCAPVSIDPKFLATLLVCCPDRRGLVAGLAQLLYGHGANLLDSDQHSDPAEGMFFQRIRFDMRELVTDRTALEQGIREVAERFEMTCRVSYAAETKRVALFVSKYDHCLYDLLLKHRAGDLVCEIALVISNRQDLAGVAAEFGIPFKHVPITPDIKAEQEAEQLKLLRAHGVDLVVLARYMQILSAEFCQALAGRVINIHHSFLPAFVGSKPYHQAHQRGVKLIG